MLKAIFFIVALQLPARVFAADAHQLFDAGQKALVVGQADQALKAFEASYKAQPAPSLFFWIAEAHRALGHKASAVRYYRQYLRRLPDGPKRADARARLAELKKGRAERDGNRGTLSLDEIDLARPAEAAPKAGTSRAGKARKPSAPKAEQSVVLPLPGEQATQQPLAIPLPVEQPVPAPPKPVEPAPAAPAPPAAKTAVAREEPPAAKPAIPSAPPRPPQAAKGTLVAPASGSETDSFIFVQYTARLLVPNGSFMLNYATTESPGAAGTIYTHGLAIGLQKGNFKNAVYLGFGTEDGGVFGSGTDTLLRYELSWQFIWAPLGPMRTLSPHLGFRVGGMGVKSERLTGGSLKPGVVLAPLAGIDLVVARWIVLTAGMGYDANIGPDLGPKASVSGFALDFGGTVRF